MAPNPSESQWFVKANYRENYLSYGQQYLKESSVIYQIRFFIAIFISYLVNAVCFRNVIFISLQYKIKVYLHKSMVVMRL